MEEVTFPMDYFPGSRSPRYRLRGHVSQQDLTNNVMDEKEDSWLVHFGSLASKGAYTPVLGKHSRNFSFEDRLAIGVDRMQKNFGASEVTRDSL